MHAVILAGGKGTRLRPYTTVFPKPLMPVGEMPILEIVLRQLKHNGFNKITIAVGYLSELLKTFFGNGEKLGLNILYSHEDKPLGTAAPLKLIKDLPDIFLMMNGDILSTINFKDFIAFHSGKGSAMTIATYKRKVHIDFGVLKSGPDGILTEYIEKPTLDYEVSMGIYAFSNGIQKFIPEDQYFDLPDLVKTLMANDEKVSTYPFEGYWLDIGRPDDYTLAVEEFEGRRKDFFYWE